MTLDEKEFAEILADPIARWQIAYEAERRDRLAAETERDALYTQVAEMAQIVRQVGAERDAAVSRSVTAKFAVGVLRDALLAYMEPAGDTPEELRKQAKSALRFAEKALPTVPPLLDNIGRGA